MDYTILRLHVKNAQREKQIETLNQTIYKQKEKINELEKINKQLEEDIGKKVSLIVEFFLSTVFQKDQRISELSDDIAEMRGAVLKLSDAKSVLTRVFDNPDTFSKYTSKPSTAMNLLSLNRKAQSIIGTPGIFTTAKRDEKIGSLRAVSQSRELEKPAQTVKKPSNLINDDDAFWYSNPFSTSTKYGNCYFERGIINIIVAQAYGGRNKYFNEHYRYGMATGNTNDSLNTSYSIQVNIAFL